MAAADTSAVTSIADTMSRACVVGTWIIEDGEVESGICIQGQNRNVQGAGTEIDVSAGAAAKPVEPIATLRIVIRVAAEEELFPGRAGRIGRC